MPKDMALLLTSPPSLLSKNPNPNLRFLSFPTPKVYSLLISRLPRNTANPRFSPVRFYSTFSGGTSYSLSVKAPSAAAGESPTDDQPDGVPSGIVDEWGEKAEPEGEPQTALSEADQPRDEDEWGGAGVGDEYVVSGNGSAPAGTVLDDGLKELKRCLVDSVYGTDLGFRASAEVRAEVSELVSQLEAANPTPAPTEAGEVLDGNWVLLYTAFSELLPLLAAGSTPLLKVKRISQAINTSSLTIENSTTLAGPFATFSFSASASFEVRTPSRIQVKFKEGTLRPPEIRSTIDLPENIDIFGQKINLLPVQQSLNPLQNAVASLARTISGLPPLKVPVPGERTSSWLLITYLDKDLRIARGDGGLFVLAKEGSPLLDQ